MREGERERDREKERDWERLGEIERERERESTTTSPHTRIQLHTREKMGHRVSTTSTQRAEKLREDGNLYFSKLKFAAAIDAYTEVSSN